MDFESMKNKTVLVTGAGRGIGKALVEKLASLGTNVFALVRSSDQLTDLQKQYQCINIIIVDLNNWDRVREALSVVPSLDGLVNNAGVAIIKPLEELSEQDFDNTMNINFKAVFNVTQALLPKLKDGSSIVMVSSLASSRSFQGHSIYSATKAALDSFTRSLALELSKRHIRVNSVNPTVVLTDMGRANWSDPKKADPLLAHIPLKRFCEVYEVVNSIIYFLSKMSNFVNGQHLLLDGGYGVS